MSHTCILFITLSSIVHIPTVPSAKWVRADDESIDVLESIRVKGLNSRASWILFQGTLATCYGGTGVCAAMVKYSSLKRLFAITRKFLPSSSLTISKCFPSSWTKVTSRVNKSYTKIKTIFINQLSSAYLWLLLQTF